MKTTFSRTIFAFGAILLAALLLVGICSNLLAGNRLKEQTISRLKNDSVTIAEIAAAYHKDNTLSPRSISMALSVASKISESDAVICDATGRLLVCSDAPLGCRHQGMVIASRGFLQKILTQEFVVSSGVIEGLYTDTRHVVSTTIRESETNRVLGIVIVSSPVKNTQKITKKVSNAYLSVSLITILAAGIALVLYTKKHSHPLRHMALTATAFGHGDLKARANVPKDSPEEIQQLALAFNNMASSLEKSEYQRKEFVANVSHELKTPMTTIGGYVDGILDGTIPSDQQNHYLRIVSDETKRLSRLVRSLLDISYLQDQGTIPEERKTRFDLEERSGSVLLSFERKIEQKNLVVEVDFPEHPVFTHACPDYITQALYNLIDNAVKFCPEGGTLGLRLREGGNKVYVSVFNDGETIPAQELPLLFDRFHKLDKSRSQNRDGWGLGLYIVKTLICGHGEDISVSSENGRTEFTFTLPLVN